MLLQYPYCAPASPLEVLAALDVAHVLAAIGCVL